MARLCHGNGDPARDGCCWVNGAPCPLRLLLRDGHVYDAAGTDLGTVDAMARNYVGNNAQRRQRVLDQLQGTHIVCRAAIDVIVADPSLLNDRAAFNAAWNAHPDYVAQVRPAWAAHERRAGLAEGSYQCSTWTGEGDQGQCCYAESQATNDSTKSALTAVAVSLRSGTTRS